MLFTIFFFKKKGAIQQILLIALVSFKIAFKLFLVISNFRLSTQKLGNGWLFGVGEDGQVVDWLWVCLAWMGNLELYTCMLCWLRRENLSCGLVAEAGAELCVFVGGMAPQKILIPQYSHILFNFTSLKLFLNKAYPEKKIYLLTIIPSYVNFERYTILVLPFHFYYSSIFNY